jgi:hypothetical protein
VAAVKDGAGVRSILTLIVVVLVVLTAAGCTSSSTTPTGIPCTNYSLKHDYCLYYVSNGVETACDVGTANLCKNAQGDYYYYNPRNGNTYECADHYYCNGTEVAASVPCSPKFAYDHLVNLGQAWEVVNKQQDQNTTPTTADSTFTSSSATTVSASASVQITANVIALFGAVFASVRAQINASVARTVNTVVGNEFTVTIPAGKTAYGIYGVKVQVTGGHLYQSNSCGSSQPDYGTVQTYVPISPGWCVWLSGQAPCRVVSAP